MSRNTGKRPHELTLELFAQNITQTPAEINAFVKNGPYCSKSIWFLRKLGHDISVSKSGRTVLYYTYNGTGTSTPTVPKPVKAPKRQVADPVAAKQNKLRPAKIRVTRDMQKAVAAKVAKLDEQIKASNLEKMKEVTAKRKIKKTIIIDEVDIDESGDFYKVDTAWDSTEGLDIRKLVA
jgi:hypothetical protein